MNNQNTVPVSYTNDPYPYYVAQQPKNNNGVIILIAVIMIFSMGIFGFIMANLMGKNSSQPTVIYSAPSAQQTVPSYPSTSPSSNNSNEIAPENKAPERIVQNTDSNIGARFTDVFVQSNDLVDNFGKTYACAYKINCVEKEFTIALDGTYRYLKGTFALSEFDSHQNYVYARITVFDENGSKIYVSGDIDEKHPEPINMCVDISGHKSVKVMIEGCSQYVCPITLISEGLYLTNEI